MKPSKAVPSLIEKPPESITIWVIAHNPPDWPHGYTLRPQFAVKLPTTPGVVDLSPYGKVIQVFRGNGNSCTVESPLVWYNKSIDELHSIMPPGCVRIGPMPGDKEWVVEVWIQ